MLNKKIKAVWICHFTNDEMQSKIPLWRKQVEFAPWIPNMLKGFENRDDIEIHIICPHDYLKKETNLFIRNIHYHFIPYGIPIWHRHWPGIFLFDVYTNYYFFRLSIKRVINQIKPNLVTLVGVENSYYSSSIFDFKNDYPILIMIQGFISQMRGAIKLTKATKKRIEVEERILTSFKYYAGEQDSSTYISKYNPNHIFFNLFGSINESIALETIDRGKNFDCIYFGRLEKIKGVEDFIKVVAEIKKRKHNIKGCIIGGGDMTPFIEIANDLNCAENIYFKGFVQTQEELFEFVKSSKVFLAPPHFERLSMTIREAMYLKVPIVAYATGGIPYINEFDENIYLVDTGDFQGMARKTLLLLEDESLRNDLAEKAFQYAVREFSLKVNTERIFSAYETMLNDCKI